jgi:hypothetical protein
MSRVYAGLLVVVALFAMAAIGTLALVVVTDVGSFAYRVLKGRDLERGADRSKDQRLCVIWFAVLRGNLENG